MGQGPQLPEFTESQQQCSPRGHCSAEAPESGIDESAGNTAEFKRPWDVIRWSPNGNEAPRYGGSCICTYCLGHCEEQERASERPLCQGDSVEQFGEPGQLAENQETTRKNWRETHLSQSLFMTAGQYL